MNSLFVELQENQANHFGYHFCIPTFMLNQFLIRSVYDIQQHFPVSFPFALHKLEVHRNKQISLYEPPAYYLAG